MCWSGRLLVLVVSKNSPGRRKVVPYTNSEVVHCRSSLKADPRFELRTTVRGDGGWSSITSDPTRDESVGDSGCCDVNKRNGFRPSSKAIHTSKQIRISLTRRERSHDVEVDMIESCFRN